MTNVDPTHLPKEKIITWKKTKCDIFPFQLNCINEENWWIKFLWSILSLTWRSQHLSDVLVVLAVRSECNLTFTLCKSTVFMMDPWKKVTVVKCLLISPSSSRPGGVLATNQDIALACFMYRDSTDHFKLLSFKSLWWFWFFLSCCGS